jgi:PAS domain S-box-containing protein
MAVSPELSRHCAMILVVDAVEAIRYARTQILSQAGHRVVEASTGEEALLMVASHRPELIVLHISLPGIDGLEVCRRLKADPNTSHIMVLQVSSAHTSKMELAAGLEVAADGYLIEPIDPAELLATVKALLRLADREKENLRLIQTARGRFFDDNAGQAIRMTGVGQDITVRKQAEDTLALYRTIIAAATDGIALIDRNARYIEQNLAHRVLLGYSDEDLLGQTPALYLGEETFQQVAGELIDTGRFRGEVRSRLKDGQWIDIALSAFGIYDDKGEVLCYVGMMRDITERKRQEATLKESEARFRNMADHSSVMVWVTEPDGACSFLSRSWYDFTGQTPETGLGFGWTNAVHADDRASTEQTFVQANNTQSAFRLEYRLRRHDGAYRWAIDAAAPRFSSEGSFLGYIGSVIDITDRKQTEQALAESEEKYRHMFENAGVSMFEEDWSDIQRWFDDLRSEGVTDLRGYLDANPEKVASSIPLIRVTDVNDDTMRLFQAPSKTALLGALDRIFTSDTSPVFKEELIAFWEGLDLHERPASLRTLSGESLSVLFTLKAPRHGGDWRRVLVTLTDVTALRVAESAVRESEVRFRTLADNISQLAWMADEKGWLFWYNRRWFDYTGTTFEDMQGWGWQKVHHEDHLQRVIEKWQRALETGGIWEDTFPLRGHDGQYRWFLSRAVPVRDNEGSITLWFGTNTDITDLREAERAQAHLASIVTSSDDAIISKDLNGIITSWNRGAERLFGYSEKEAIGLPVTVLFPRERIHEAADILAHIKMGESIEHYETLSRRKDGTLVNISLTVSPIKDDAGRIIGASKVARDITDRKRQEEELYRLKNDLEDRVRERTKELLATQERLIAVTSQLSLTEQRERRKLARDLHDYLAQMLAVGQMKTSMLKKQSPSHPGSATLVQDLDQVFQQALVYTRTLIAELSPPSLQDSGLPAALTWLGERFEKDGLRVEVRTDCDSVPLAEEQAVVVFHAVRELLFNVIKHAGVDRATVDLSLHEEGLLQITVSDQGRGLSADAMQRSSEPGHLGLFSVRERIEAMGGWVDMESSPGQGTTVTLMLRIGDTTPSTEPHVPSPDPSRRYADGLTQDHTPIRVLLVDDHKLVRQGLRDILAADERIRVVGEAGTCEEALMLVANLAPDVVITDINLPAMSGIEATKRFKKLYPQMSVIGLSCHAEEHIKQDMLSAGAEVLLSKERAADELAANIVTIYAKTSGM